MEKPNQINYKYKFKKLTPQQFKNNVKKFKQTYTNNNNNNKQPYNPKLKRSHSQDNLRQPNLDDIINAKLDNRLNKVESDNNKRISDIMTRESNKLNALIEFKTKYYIDQKLTMLEGADYNLRRGIDEFTIASDNAQAGNSFQFKYNNTVVAKITESGILYCKNIWINGVNILSIINDLITSNATAASNYVRHKDLKHGTYEMDISDIITKTATVTQSLTVNSTTTNTPVTINGTTADDDRYVNVSIGGINNAVQADKYNTSTSLMDMLECVNWGTPWMSFINYKTHMNNFLSYLIDDTGYSNITENTILFGYEDLTGDSLEITYHHTAHNDSNNHITIGYWDTMNLLLSMYRDYLNYYCPIYNDGIVYDNNDHHILANGNLYILNNSLGYNNSKFIIIGKANTNYNAGCIQFINLNGDTSNYLRLALVDSTNTTGHIDIFKGEVDINVPTLISVTNNSSVLRCYNTGETAQIKLGQNQSYKHAVITCYSPSDLAHRYLSLGLDAYTFNLVIYYNKVDVNKQLNVNDKLYVQSTSEFNLASTFNKGIHILNNTSDMLYSTLTAGNDVVFTFGKSTGTYSAAQLGYHLDSTLANSYAYLTLTAMSGLKVWSDKVESVTPLYCPSLYINGTPIDVSHIAYTNVINNFTQTQWIKSTNTTDASIFIIEDTALTNGHSIYYAIGQSFGTTANCGYYGFKYVANASTSNCLTMGLGNGFNALKVYSNKVETNVPVNINGKTIIYKTMDSGNGWTYAFDVLCNDLATQNWVGAHLGKNASGNDCLELAYYYDNDTPANKRIKIGFYTSATNSTYIYPNYTEFNQMVNIKSPITNGIAFQVNTARISVNNETYIKWGRDCSTTLQHGFLAYGWKNNNANNYIKIGLWGGAEMVMGRDNVSIIKQLTVSGQLTANKLETTNNTAAAAIGNNLQTAIRELINDSSVSTVIPKQQEANNTYMISYDNYFRTIPSPNSVAPGQAVAYSDELKMFISLGYNTGKGLYSYDGVSWTVMNIPAKPFKAVCWGDAGFVAILYDTSRDTYTSLDGINWTRHAGALISLSSYVINIKFCNDIYCVLQDANTEYWQLSLNGVNWYQQTFGNTGRWKDIAYANERFVAVGEQGKWCSSNNIASWTYGQFPTTNYNIYSICYGKKGWLAVCQTYYYYSTNGTTWTQGTLPYSGIGNYGIYALGRYFVIPAQNNNHMMVTYDLINWQSYGTTNYSYHYTPMFGNNILVCPVKSENAIDVYNPSNTLNNTRTILESVYPVGDIYTSSRNISPDKLFGFGTWTSIFTGYERQCVGSQVLYNQVIGNGPQNNVSLLGVYNYSLINGVFASITIPTGYHKEYRLTFQGTTGGASTVQVFLNNIRTTTVETWSTDSFRILGASNYFKESDITLETTMGYSNPGINLKYSNSGNFDYRIYNITLHGFIVSDTQTYKWKRTA